MRPVEHWITEKAYNLLEDYIGATLFPSDIEDIERIINELIEEGIREGVDIVDNHISNTKIGKIRINYSLDEDEVVINESVGIQLQRV